MLKSLWADKRSMSHDFKPCIFLSVPPTQSLSIYKKSKELKIIKLFVSSWSGWVYVLLY